MNSKSIANYGIAAFLPCTSIKWYETSFVLFDQTTIHDLLIDLGFNKMNKQHFSKYFIILQHKCQLHIFSNRKRYSSLVDFVTWEQLNYIFVKNLENRIIWYSWLIKSWLIKIDLISWWYWWIIQSDGKISKNYNAVNQ